MSITEGIELRTKDGEQKDYVSWKEWSISMWIFDYLCKELQSPVMNIPHTIIKSMGEALATRNFEICQDAYEYFEYDEFLKARAEGYGKGFLEMIKKATEDDIFIYYDCGN